MHAPQGKVLYGPSRKKVGYSETLSTKIEDHLYRDSTDVAVKITLYLNELQLEGNILTIYALEEAINLQISNQKNMATYLTKDTDGKPIIDSLSTDYTTRNMNIKTLENKRLGSYETCNTRITNRNRKEKIYC